MATGAKLSGRSEMVAKLRKFQKGFPDEVARALYIETEVEAKEVKRRTPVHWYPKGVTGPAGALRASVHVEGPVREGTRIFTKIVAGGPAAPYAVYVHEDPDAFHHTGQWKFIESVIMESRPYMGQRVAKRIEINSVV